MYIYVGLCTYRHSVDKNKRMCIHINMVRMYAQKTYRNKCIYIYIVPPMDLPFCGWVNPTTRKQWIVEAVGR